MFFVSLKGKYSGGGNFPSVSTHLQALEIEGISEMEQRRHHHFRLLLLSSYVSASPFHLFLHQSTHPPGRAPTPSDDRWRCGGCIGGGQEELREIASYVTRVLQSLVMDSKPSVPEHFLTSDSSTMYLFEFSCVQITLIF